MILNVKMIKNPSIYCNESAMATVAEWLNRDYAMIFSEMLGFNFLKKEHAKDKRLGERIDSGYKLEDLVQALKVYHGISVENKRVDKNIIDIISDQINKEMPVLTFVCARFCDWIKEKNYKIYFLIIGYDDFYVYGYDLHSDSDNIQKLPIKVLQKNYLKKNKVQLYKIVGNEKDVKFEIVKDIIRQKKYNESQTFLEMKNFADELEEVYSTKTNYGKDEKFNYTLTLDKLTDIVRGRKLFSQTCYYIAEKTGDEFAHYVGGCYAEIGEQWNVVWRMLAKIYILNCENNEKNSVSSIIKEVADSIRKVSDAEKELIENILGDCIIYDKTIKPLNNIKVDKGYKYIDVDIFKLLDNKGFEEPAGEIKADLTGHGEFFLWNDLLDSKVIKFGEAAFHINAVYDNFLCNGQKISVSTNTYKKIYILGCAEWGSGSGKIQIGNDSYCESLLMDFPDWYYCKMDNDCNVWHGQALDYKHNKVERGLFCLDYELNQSKKISWIQFPIISNVHIFGIKLLV